MKSKSIVLSLVALLLLGIVSAGFAFAAETEIKHEEDTQQEFRKGHGQCSEKFSDELSEEEQEKLTKAFEDYKGDMEKLREEFQEKKAELREDFHEELPEEVRENLEEKKQDFEKRQKNREMNGKQF